MNQPPYRTAVNPTVTVMQSYILTKLIDNGPG